jgi:hypothetical protein
MQSNVNAVHREPWNKGKIVGQKTPFKLKDIWALRVRLQMESRVVAALRVPAPDPGCPAAPAAWAGHDDSYRWAPGGASGRRIRRTRLGPLSGAAAMARTRAAVAKRIGDTPVLSVKK